MMSSSRTSEGETAAEAEGAGEGRQQSATVGGQRLAAAGSRAMGDKAACARCCSAPVPKVRGSLDTSVAAAPLPASLRPPMLEAPANAAKGLPLPTSVPSLLALAAALAREAVGWMGASLARWLL